MIGQDKLPEYIEKWRDSRKNHLFQQFFIKENKKWKGN